MDEPLIAEEQVLDIKSFTTCSFHTLYEQMRVKFSYRVLILNIYVMYIDVCKI